MADLTDNTINVTESEFLNKLQELKEREDFLTQKETVLAQKEQALQAAKDAMAQKEAELNDKYVHLQEMELQAKTAFRNSLRKSSQHSKNNWRSGKLSV
jgi:maltodextrin utilization protein YvdJ